LSLGQFPGQLRIQVFQVLGQILGQEVLPHRQIAKGIVLAARNARQEERRRHEQ
jgi:hypothetical protein